MLLALNIPTGPGAGCLAAQASAASSVAKRALLFPWDSVAADLQSKGWDKAGCPKAAYVMDWELWNFSTQDPKLEFIPCVRTKDGMANVQSYMASNNATKLAFLNGKISIVVSCSEVLANACTQQQSWHGVRHCQGQLSVHGVLTLLLLTVKQLT